MYEITHLDLSLRWKYTFKIKNIKLPQTLTVSQVISTPLNVHRLEMSLSLRIQCMHTFHSR
jgi:hypothetical protein